MNCSLLGVLVIRAVQQRASGTNTHNSRPEVMSYWLFNMLFSFSLPRARAIDHATSRCIGMQNNFYRGSIICIPSHCLLLKIRHRGLS